ncbi:acyl-CoA dehydrogenase family protein [Mycobacterium sp.]|uniref:acyl-CoA dehydrogenase family protein n=1 Tax=Mycobacterium sp. TaxID=1785 RepID=UPI003BAE57A6
MDFTLTEEQQHLQQVARAFFEKRSPEAEVRRLMATGQGFDRQLWADLADMGLLGLCIPSQWGGSDAGPVEVGIVMEEAGRALLVAPYFATVALAIPALLYTQDHAACDEYLPRIASGQCVATLAVTEQSGSWNADTTESLARHDGAGWRLEGTKAYVPAGNIADLIIVTAQTPAGPSVFAVDAHSPGLIVTPLPTIDQTRKQATVELRDVPARLLGAQAAAPQILDRVLDLAAVWLAAEQSGGARRALEMAVAYAKIRHQFNRPIGSFQAVKTICADMLIAVECSTSAALYGLWAAAEASPELPVAASLAKAFCSDAFKEVSAKNIQVHGGIGFTWEHPAHLYYKRARSSAVLLGDARQHRAALASRIGY